MFDIGWSELMVLGIIALIVVGPKELPALLRTVGRYTGFLRKQAADFRAQFDQALREAELDQLKRDVQGFKDDITSTVRSTTKSLTDEIDKAKSQLEIPELDDPDAHDSDGMPIVRKKAEPSAPAAAEIAAPTPGEAAAAQPPSMPAAADAASAPSETLAPDQTGGSAGREQRGET